MNALIAERIKPVMALAIAVPSSSTPDYVSLKNVTRLSILITILNGSTVTGSAITLKQATAVAATGEKALAFSTMWANTDCAAGDDFTKTTVTSDTFTTDTTNAKILQYIIEVDPTDLDMDNGFDCVRLGAGNTANTLLFSATYHCEMKTMAAVADLADVTSD